MSQRAQGFLWCATFVVLDAAQAVLFGSFLQTLDSFLIGFLVFGVSSVACLALVLLRSPEEIRAALRYPRTLVALNLCSAGGWIAYLGAIPAHRAGGRLHDLFGHYSARGRRRAPVDAS